MSAFVGTDPAETAGLLEVADYLFNACATQFKGCHQSIGRYSRLLADQRKQAVAVFLPTFLLTFLPTFLLTFLRHFLPNYRQVL